MSRFLFYPHARGVIQRLPEHYKKRYLEKYAQNAKISYFEDSNNNYPKEYFESPPKVIYPEESQRALWGGEGIVTGFDELKRTRTKVPKTWAPELRQHVFYSEILDRWLMIIVSLTALKQIEKLKGLDGYLLTTPENEINSRLGMHIKRELLMTLANSDFQERKPNITSKYAKFIVPLEEAEWIGLTLDEAIKKQMKIEHTAERAAVSVPKKVAFAKDLLNHLDSKTKHPQSGRRCDDELGNPDEASKPTPPKTRQRIVLPDLVSDKVQLSTSMEEALPKKVDTY
ncbi:unnamed protein product [Mesocestoides corti]|uniref:Large ribosomal subunit protein bL28m n=1 Tax=Mesocestoides corti TaxID=53468 RepID=A0A0R3U1V8_MESCO|nr:unnamed protein product [Mesocestoides corti]